MLRNFPSWEGITSTIFAIMSFGSSLPSGFPSSPATIFWKASRLIKFTSSLSQRRLASTTVSLKPVRYVEDVEKRRVRCDEVDLARLHDG
jgi:hypothetical protein